jgi:uncharacterized protein
MPVNVTYPGVYVDEVKSSVKTITGVPTAVAAFVGYAPRGPVDRPVHITGWADYEAVFGGLRANCPLSYAVYQFYLNGGSEAEIVRVVSADKQGKNTIRLPLGAMTTSTASQSAGTSTPPAPEGAGSGSPTDTEENGSPGEEKKRGRASGSANASDNALVLRAASPGRWGLSLRARVDWHTAEDKQLSETQRTLFNLTVRDLETGVEERYLNVSIEPDSPRNLAHLLESSRLVRVDSHDPVTAVPGQNAEAKEGADPFTFVPEGGRAGQPPWCYVPAAAGQGRAEEDERPLDLDPYVGNRAAKTGLYQLLKTDIFNVLCLPDSHWLSEQLQATGGRVDALREAALQLCVERRAILLVDPPSAWTGALPGGDSNADVVDTVVKTMTELESLGESGKNAAVYYPRVLASDPLLDGALRPFPPCGVMAGVLARTDVQRGVWKAPAGTDASLSGVSELEVTLTDLEIGRLNPVGVNCLRRLPAAGPVAWGARTLRGADRLAGEWKYLPVRRLALFIEESLFRGTHWVVFEPNDEPLWASIRLNVGAFMNSLFRAGAFQGRTPQDAYLVKCDKDTNPQNDIDRGIVNIQVGFAPLKPAEFVIVHIQQLAGQIQV